MRRTVILFALLIARGAQGQINVISQNQAMSVSGNVFIHNLSSNYTFSATSGSVGGDITLTDSNADQFGFSCMMAGFRSTANMQSGQGNNGLFCDSRVQARGFGPVDGSSGNGNGDASSGYQVSFTVSSPLAFQMSVSNFNFAAPYGGEVGFNYTFTLSSANQGFIGGWSSGGEIPNPGGSTFTGILEPGDIYTFQDFIETGGQVEDPNSETGAVGADVTLSLVPEPSAVWLFGIGVVAFGALRMRAIRGRQA